VPRQHSITHLPDIWASFVCKFNDWVLYTM
jgi:hypothetical protein